MAEHNTTTINNAEICSNTNSEIGMKTVNGTGSNIVAVSSYGDGSNIVACSSYGAGSNIKAGSRFGAGRNRKAGSSFGAGSNIKAGSSFGAECNIMAGSSFGAGRNILAVSSYGVGSNIEAGSSYRTGSNIKAGSSFGPGSNIKAGSSFGAGRNIMVGSSNGDGSNTVAGSSTDTGRNMEASSSIGTGRNIAAGSRTGTGKVKETCPGNGTGESAIATTSKCTEMKKMKEQREHKERVVECSNNDTGTGIHDKMVHIQTLHLGSGVVPGHTIYGTESEVLELCDEFEDSTVHTGAILNSYAGQIHVSTKRYEAGKDYLFESNKYAVQKGYFGSVYVCIDKTNRYTGIFVIKDIDLNKFKTDKEKVKVHVSLRREIKALIYCRHENIVRLIGLIKEQGHIKVLLEYGGDPLLSMVRDKALDQQKLLKWFKGLLSGILCMHEQRCVHCDLHIGNLLIDQQDDLKICDLGSAKLIDEPLFTVSHGYTACYFPPTVLKHYLGGKSNDVKVRVRIDLYAIGKLLLEIVSGRGGVPIKVEELKPVIWSKGKWSSFVENKIPETCSKVIQCLITHLMGYTSEDGFSDAYMALDYIRQNIQRKIHDDKYVELPSVTSAAFPERIRHQSQEEPMDTMES